jgi:hypothetical protein
MQVKDKLYKHSYTPIISREIYDCVHTIKSGFNKKHSKYAGLPYDYRGLIHCSYCGCILTCESQKGHMYYTAHNI